MRRAKLQGLARSALFAAVLCILCPVAIPVGPVPVTLGVFAVLLTGIVLDWREAATAVLVYLLLGAIGLPVFSGGGAGFGVLIGPTGGYLWCYLPMVALVAISGRRGGAGWLIPALSMAAALVLCYGIGTLQFVWLTRTQWHQALRVCVWPFVVFDAFKLAGAAFFGLRIRRRLRSAGFIK